MVILRRSTISYIDSDNNNSNDAIIPPSSTTAARLLRRLSLNNSLATTTTTPSSPDLLLYGTESMLSSDNSKNKRRKQNKDDNNNNNIKSWKRWSSLFSLRRKKKNNNQIQKNVSTTTANNNNELLLHWIKDTCPEDAVIKILAYTGPQTILSLSKTNTYFNNIVNKQDYTWKILCQEYGKWHEGMTDEQIPITATKPITKPIKSLSRSRSTIGYTWKDYYCTHPIVPDDYACIETALLSGTTAAVDCGTYHVHILCRAGHHAHTLRRAIPILFSRVHITIETLQQPQQKNYYDDKIIPSPKMAVIKQRATTSYMNEPSIRIYPGANLILKNIKIQHNTIGNDIWNGNAAIHVAASNNITNSLLSTTNRITLHNVDISSKSGRGIVIANNNMSLNIHNSYIHDCAATGLYVSDPNASVHLHQADIVHNGIGNNNNRNNNNNRILQGHSGIYIEKGSLYVSNSNISGNSGSGITIINEEQEGNNNNNVVSIKSSDVILNGMDPPIEFAANNSVDIHNNNNNNNSNYSFENNHIAIIGTMKPRSQLYTSIICEQERSINH